MKVQLTLALVLFYISSVTCAGSYWSVFRPYQWQPTNNQTNTTSQPFVDKPPPIFTDGKLPQLDQAYAKCSGIDIRELTISQAQSLFTEGRLSSLELTKCYLLRIQKMNHVLKAVIEVNPDAILEAYQADLGRPQIKDRSQIHGIPVLIKDNVAVFYFMETTAGAAALEGIRPRRDADIVKLLRKKGAVILGKANLSEFAYFLGTNIPSGWSQRGGQTRNPYNLNETPDGSSSGSATGVSANLAMVSVGSETDGSLICPSAVQALFTIKPTLHLISTGEVIPISHNQDNLGPMARTVTDMAILLDAILPGGSQAVQSCGGSYTSCLSQRDPKKVFRVGVLRYPFWDLTLFDSPHLEFELPTLERTLKDLSSLPNVQVVDPVTYDRKILTQISFTNELIVLTHDFKYGINSYLRNNVIVPYPIPRESSQKDKYRDSLQISFSKRIASLKDIIEYNNKHPLPNGYNQDLLIMSEATNGLKNKTYLDALQSNRGGARQLFDAAFDTYHLDAVIVPSENKLGAPKDTAMSDTPIRGYSFAAIAGYPSIHVPIGIGLDGVPFGLLLVGKPYSEVDLLQLALIMEQMSQGRKMPTFRL